MNRRPRAKTQFEVIRTVAVLVAVLIQVLVLLRVYEVI